MIKKLFFFLLMLSLATNKFYAQTPQTLVDSWGKKVFTPNLSELFRILVLNDKDFKNELIKKGFEIDEMQSNQNQITFSPISRSFSCMRKIDTNYNHTILLYSATKIKEKEIADYLNGVKRQIQFISEDTSAHNFGDSKLYFIKKDNSTLALISFSIFDDGSGKYFGLDIRYPPMASEKEKPQESKTGLKSFKIDSDNIYNTLTVSKGENITITASGSIVLGTWAGSSGPQGINGYTGYNRIAGFRHGALLVRIGDNGIWEEVGLSKQIIAGSPDFYSLW